MTDKPIIIDDKYWEKKYADMHIRLTNENSELREQLKRKEQECEELKKSVRSNKDKRKRAIEKYIRLKEFTDKNFNQFEIDMEKAENERFKQALQEIKDYCNKYPQNSIGFKKQILQKCEVIDAN